MNDLEKLCHRLNYTFNDMALLENALTHRSVGSQNNERLEFLGDAILSFLIGRELFDLFPQASEGDLSRLRSYLVKGEALAEIAKEIELGHYLVLGQGEMRSGGHRRTSILADSFEAVVAAVYLDSNIDEVACLIKTLYAKRLTKDHLAGNLKDPKTYLQELLQGNKFALPSYQLKDVKGDQHEQIFQVICSVDKLQLRAEGRGASRRKAEQEAAKALLTMVKKRLV